MVPAEITPYVNAKINDKMAKPTLNSISAKCRLTIVISQLHNRFEYLCNAWRWYCYVMYKTSKPPGNSDGCYGKRRQNHRTTEMVVTEKGEAGRFELKWDSRGYPKFKQPASCYDVYWRIRFSYFLAIWTAEWSIWFLPLFIIQIVWNIRGLLLLTWINFNPSMNKWPQAQWSLCWNYLSIPKLQWLHRWSLGMDKLFQHTILMDVITCPIWDVPFTHHETILPLLNKHLT